LPKNVRASVIVAAVDVGDAETAPSRSVVVVEPEMGVNVSELEMAALAVVFSAAMAAVIVAAVVAVAVVAAVAVVVAAVAVAVTVAVAVAVAVAAVVVAADWNQAVILSYSESVI